MARQGKKKGKKNPDEKLAPQNPIPPAAPAPEPAPVRPVEPVPAVIPTPGRPRICCTGWAGRSLGDGIFFS
jgi:hypothetical protein